jgi:hypothetical protein
MLHKIMSLFLHLIMEIHLVQIVPSVVIRGFRFACPQVAFRLLASYIRFCYNSRRT